MHFVISQSFWYNTIMFHPKQLELILSGTQMFTAPEIEKFKTTAAEKKRSLEDYLLGERLISEDALYENAAAYYHLPFLKLKNQPINKDILYLIPEPLAEHYQIIAYEPDGDNGLKILTTDPENLQAFDFLRKKTGKQLTIALTTPTAWKELAKQYHKTLEAEFDDLTGIGGKDKNRDLNELAQDLPVIRIVETILEYAIFESASDIHIEPEEAELGVRYRIDGILRHIMSLPKSIQPGILARIKVLSNLKLDEHRLPQDGRFKIQNADYKISFRVSIIPTFDGEKAVLRLLNEGTQLMSLNQIALQPDAMNVLKKNIAKPHGMLLVTGPTGSGKTTTLYTILNVLNKPEVNISTIEDPIEYRMPHVNQSQVNPKIGYTFAMGLRAFLRQDPNIIMVGEIRDTETAEIAVNAAMTGHLLLSTLHTNDAATAIPRLFDMGIPPFLVSSTVNMIMAQRLVRKICTSCITSYNIDRAAMEQLKRQFDLTAVLNMLISRGSVVKGTKTFDKLLFYRGKGCKQCNNEGYRSRIGIYEILDISHEMADLISRKGSREQVFTLARQQGMMTLVEDGFLKAKQGLTSIEEVLRVTQE